MGGWNVGIGKGGLTLSPPQNLPESKLLVALERAAYSRGASWNAERGSFYAHQWTALSNGNDAKRRNT